MAVQTSTSRIAYTADGLATVFAYPFIVYLSTDLQVYVAGVLKTLTADYTVSNVGIATGGNVTFVTAPAAGASVVLVRNVPFTQTFVFPYLGAFPEKDAETGLDRVCILAQQLLEKVGRAVLLATSSLFAGLTLPDPVATKLLRWKADLTGLENVDATTIVPSTTTLPLSLANGGTSASYATAHALAKGLGLARWRQGTDITAAATIVLPDPADGNLYVISGGTTVSFIDSTNVAIGTVIALRFSGTVNFNSTTNLQLLGVTNHTYTSDDIAVFQMFNATKWREITRATLPSPSDATKFWRGDGTWAAPDLAAVTRLQRALNLSILPNGVTPNTKVDLAADLVAASTFIKTTAFSVTVDTGTVGANGLDAGTLAASTLYGVWIIYNPTTDTWAGLLSTSLTAPTLPSGYTVKWLAGTRRTDGAVHFLPWRQQDTVVSFDTPIKVVSAGTATTATSIDLSAYLPPNPLKIALHSYQSGAGGNAIGYHWQSFTAGSLANLSANAVVFVATNLAGWIGGWAVSLPALGATRTSVFYALLNATATDIFLDGYEMQWKA